MINITKTFLPPIEEYVSVLSRAWDKNWLTNNGELVIELEQKLKEYLDVAHLVFCSNGTIVLQMALKALKITKEVITTPFSYVATTNAILWEGCTPVFVDIKSNTFCIDENKIEAAITEDTQAILATHVYGFPCNVEKIDFIAQKYNLKVIYDGAHAFGSKYKGKSLLNFGDISTCSFHATKVFHTVEGGAVICKDQQLIDQLFLFRSFGHIYDDYFSVGINAKNSELHAAMGLCILPRVETHISVRKRLSEKYDELLKKSSKSDLASLEHNYSYYPIILESESILLKVKAALEKLQIYSRRYFHPSINMLPFIPYKSCPVSETIASSVLCLPLYPGLKEEEQELICDEILSIRGRLC